METSLETIQALVSKIKEKFMSNGANLAPFASLSDYGAARLPVIRTYGRGPTEPRFQGQLGRILEKELSDGNVTMDDIATTLAYIIVLKKWEVGHELIEKDDEELTKLKVVDHLQRLGLADHFSLEIREILRHVYLRYKEEEDEREVEAGKINKDFMRFQLLRMHGFHVSPRGISWFLKEEEAKAKIEENIEEYLSAIYNMYRATNLMFEGEFELQSAKVFSSRLLQKCLLLPSLDPLCKQMIKHEITVPWVARMDHLENRRWIELNEHFLVQTRTTSFSRLSNLDDDDIIQLAKENFNLRQSIYQKELEDLSRWSKKSGIKDMGFAREKRVYSYFAVAASSSSFLLPDSEVRLIVAKSAALITVADDFYDMQGSLDDLALLTQAVHRWDNKDLRGYSKIIFDALNDIVKELASKYLLQHRIDITADLRHIWYETFNAWLKEATWSRKGEIPTMEEYLETGMISIAAHTLALPASLFLTPTTPAPHPCIHPSSYQPITKFLMLSTRLLNDLQSYQKEEKEGKINSVLLYLKENPDADLQDAITHVENLLEQTKRNLIEHAFLDGLSDLPKPSRLLHLSAMKVFQMFFNGGNLFDSNTSLLNDIKRAIYIPLEGRSEKTEKGVIQFDKPAGKIQAANHSHYRFSLKCPKRKSFSINYRVSPQEFVPGIWWKLNVPPRVKVFSFLN